LVDHVIAGQSIPDVSLVHSGVCMGEVFTSVKQFLKRNSVLPMSTQPTGNGIQIWPFFNTMTWLNSSGIGEYGLWGPDAYSFIAPMYNNFHGGVNVMVDFLAGTSAPLHSYLSVGLQGSSTAPIAANSLTITNGAYAWKTGNNQGFSGMAVADPVGITNFNVPYYCPTKHSLVEPILGTSFVPTDYSQPATFLVLESSGNEFATSEYNLYRSFRDDFHLGYFVGTVPLVYRIH